MPKRKLKLRPIAKRKTRTGSFRYYDTRTKKRISKDKYYSRLKRYHTRSKTTLKKKQSKQHKIEKRKIKGRFSKGFNFSRRTNLSFEQSGIERIVSIIDSFYLSVRGRFKSLKKLMYIQIKGWLIGEDENLEFIRSTRLSFVKQYEDTDFRLGEIRRTVQAIFDLFGETKYQADDFRMTRISVNQRD